jgi:hypothetical protein
MTRTNDSTLAMEVVALKPIAAGEEIVVSYLDMSEATTSQERHERITSHWNFECRCLICVGKEAIESDFRRKQITKATEKLQNSYGDVEGILVHLTILIDLYKKEGMILSLAEHYHLAAYMADRLKLEEDAIEFATSARKYWEIIFGRDSREAKEMNQFVQTPETRRSRRRLKKSKTMI